MFRPPVSAMDAPPAPDVSPLPCQGLSSHCLIRPPVLYHRADNHRDRQDQSRRKSELLMAPLNLLVTGYAQTVSSTIPARLRLKRLSRQALACRAFLTGGPRSVNPPGKQDTHCSR